MAKTRKRETQPRICIPSIQKIPWAQPCPSLTETCNIETPSDPSPAAPAKKLGPCAQLVRVDLVPKRNPNAPAILGSPLGGRRKSLFIN